MSEELTALVEHHRRRIVGVVPGAAVSVSGSASLERLVPDDLDFVALVDDVGEAAARLRAVYPPLHEDEWREDWAAFRDRGPPQVDVVATRPGSRGDAHHRLAWELLAADETLLAEYRALKATTVGLEQRKAAFFERMVDELTRRSGTPLPPC